jgi:Ala-tRNA(Pro) deacylase
MAARQRLETYLREEGVSFETMIHSVAYTAQEVAAAQHTPGRQLAKVVLAVADGKRGMLVLPAREEEFAGTFTDCEVGAMPPFGSLYDLPVYVDGSLCDAREIVFKVGGHTTSMKMRYSDYERLVQPKIVDIATHL